MIRRILAAWVASAVALAALMIYGGWRRTRNERSRIEGVQIVCRCREIDR